MSHPLPSQSKLSNKAASVFLQRWYLFTLGLNTLEACASTLTERGWGANNLSFELWSGTFLRKHRYQAFPQNKFLQHDCCVRCMSSWRPRFLEHSSQLATRAHVLLCVGAPRPNHEIRNQRIKQFKVIRPCGDYMCCWMISLPKLTPTSLVNDRN